jgi:hypothetical protein
MYIGTKYMGVYYTEDFTGTDQPSDQPTWGPVNAGLPSTVVGDDTFYYVRQLSLDPRDQANRQYCLMGTTTTYGDLYRREVGVDDGTWSRILSEAQANTLTGLSNGEIRWIAVNQNPSASYDGHIYALFGETYSPPSNYGDVFVLKSADYGENWTVSDSIKQSSVHLVYTFGTMVAYGSHFYVSWNRAVGGGSGLIAYSSDSGSSWSSSASLGGSLWIPQLSLPPSNYTSVYCNSNDTDIGVFDLAIYDTSIPSLTELQGSLNVGILRTDAMWHSAEDPDHQRLLKSNKLYVTTDAWDSVEDSSPDSIDDTNVGAIRAPSEDESLIMLGRTSVSESYPEHILVMNDESETSPIGKSGIDPENDLTTVSIPYTGGGICYEGIQPVIAP